MTIKKMGLKKITLNYDQHQLTGLELMQGDTLTRGYSILVTDADGRVIKASPDYELRMYCVNMAYPEQTYYRIAEINGDRYDVIVPTSALTQKGRIKVQVGLYEGDDTAIYSRVWEGRVGESLPQGGATEGSDLVVDFTKLTLAIEKVDALEGEYEESLAEQRLIKEDVDTKHTEVTDMHTELSTTLEKELERQASETARNTAEEERVSAESERKSSEEARKANETDRQGKESARQSVEAGRVSAENTRKTNEDTRVANENERNTAETARASAESERASAEQTRATNENARVAQYNSLQELLTLFGENPNAEMALQIQNLTAEDIIIAEKMLAVAHNLDNSKELIKHENKLYKSKVKLIENEPTLTHVEVGDYTTNGVITHTISSTASKIRLYFKIQGTGEGHVLIASEDEKHKLVVPVSNRTRHASCELEFVEGNSKVFNFLCFVAVGQEIKIWDYDEREVV